MTPDQWFTSGRDVVMLMIAVLVFYWGRDRQQGLDAIKLQFTLQDAKIETLTNANAARITLLERAMDDASERSSKLTGMVQMIIGRLDRLPEDMREKFMSIDVANNLIEESRKDRAALWVAVQHGGRNADRQKLKE